MSTSVTIQVYDDEPSPQPVVGVAVEVYVANSSFVTSGTTDSSGSVNFLLPDGDYDIRFYQQGLSILPRQPQRITVDHTLSSNTFKVTGHVRTLPESPDPKRCRISGYFVGPDGRASKSIRLALEPEADVVINNTNIVVPRSTLLFESDRHTGYMQFDLLRGVNYHGYLSEVEKLLGHDPPKHEIVVADVAAVALFDLLFPLPVNVVFSQTSITIPLSAGPNSTVTVTITFSDGSQRTKQVPWAIFNLSSADNGVVEALLVDGQTVMLSPVALGTTTVTMTRTLPPKFVIDTAPTFTSQTLTVTVV